MNGATLSPCISSLPSSGIRDSKGRVFKVSVASPTSWLEITDVDANCPCLISPLVSMELIVSVSGRVSPSCHGAELIDAVNVASIGSLAE